MRTRALAATAAAALAAAAAPVFDVRDYGARPDGTTLRQSPGVE